MKRVIIALVGAAACCLGMWQAARIGWARNLAQKAILVNETISADRAVALLPTDAETHATRGHIFQRLGKYAEGCRDLERAIQLRPRDYFLWMLLGVTRDLNQDQPGALQALRQSVALAPAYAKPHWLLGNLLLRQGSLDEAFNELRIASTSDESLLPNVIDLAWGTSGRDPAQTLNAVRPQSDNAHLVLAVFFAHHEHGAAAMGEFRSVKSPSLESVHKLMRTLLDRRLFIEAYEVWTKVHGLSSANPALLNGSFEDEIAIGEQGFGWQIANNISNVTMSADPSQYQNGKKSLRIDFRGDSDPSTPIVSQLVLVSPRTRYRLAFQALSKEFISIGSPVLIVSDASNEKMPALAQAAGLSGAGVWREFTLDFTTGDQTRAIRLSLVRQGCGSNPCAAFGTVWLDSFALGGSVATSASNPNTPRQGL